MLAPREERRPRRLPEQRKLFRDGVELTALGFLIGEQSIVAGGSDGSGDRVLRLDMGRLLAHDLVWG